MVSINCPEITTKVNVLRKLCLPILQNFKLQTKICIVGNSKLSESSLFLEEGVLFEENEDFDFDSDLILIAITGFDCNQSNCNQIDCNQI